MQSAKRPSIITGTASTSLYFPTRHWNSGSVKLARCFAGGVFHSSRLMLRPAHRLFVELQSR